MGTSARRRIAAVAAFLVSLASFGFAFINAAPTAEAATVEPQLVEGARNQSCAEFGDWLEVKIDPPSNGTHGDGTLSVTISNLAGDKTFDWSSNIGVDAVYVKAGAGGSYLYLYDPPAESFGDTGLTSPGSGNEISHVSFCYDVETTTTTAPTTTTTTAPTTTTTTAPTTTTTTAPTTTTTTAPTTTTTTAPTTTTTLPPPPGPSCPPPPDGSIVIPIDDPAPLRLTTRSWAAGHREIGGVGVLPAGTYLVSLGSYDPSHYPVPPGDTAGQPREEWLLEFWTGEARIAESSATPDLEDDEWFAYYPNLGTVTLDEDVTRVFARHNLWGAGSSTDPEVAGVLEVAPTVNSIDAACAYLTPLPPEPGRIIVAKAFDVNADGVADDLPPMVESPEFGFESSYGTDFSLTIGSSNDSGELPAGTYSVNETTLEFVAGDYKWRFVAATCSNGSPVDAIEVAEGETVTCTFLNTRVEVGGIQVTTTTTAPTTTTTAAVAPSTLPFTGPTDGSLVPIGIAFALIGLLLLAASYRKEEGQVI
jgi:hypothetical protein